MLPWLEIQNLLCLPVCAPMNWNYFVSTCNSMCSFAGNNVELPSLPFHVVTKPSQLPVEFLEPSAAKKLVIGFDCEGVDLCRHGALCIMQVS